MKLKSFGCSFIFGTDLHDDGRDGSYATASNHSFPALIARDKGMIYECHARPGAGNFEIANNIFNEISDKEPSIFIVNWTWIDRFSYIDESMTQNRINYMRWRTIMPVDADHRAEFYYKHLHTQMRDKIETLMMIYSVVNCLQSREIPWIMTCIDSLIWEDQWSCPTSVRYLQQATQSVFRSFEGHNFIDWSRSKGFPISDTLHPLEQAHRAAADLILSNWDQYLCHSA